MMFRLMAFLIGFTACAAASGANFKAPVTMSEASGEAIRGKRIAVARPRGPLFALFTPAREILLFPAWFAAQVPQIQGFALVALPGVGPWTAAYVRLRALGDPDVFLPTDLGVKHALTALGGEMNDQTKWRPWRSYALHHLWASLPATKASAA